MIAKNSRRNIPSLVAVILLFNLYWYGAFLSFPLLGEDGAANYSFLLENLKNPDAFSTVFPYKWLEGLGQPNAFVTVIFDPFSWIMLLPFELADTFRVSMALRATVCWAATFLLSLTLFKGRRDIAVLAASLNMLMNFTLGHTNGVPTAAGIPNSTHYAVFPLLLWSIYRVMRQRSWFGWPDAVLLGLLAFFFITFPLSSIIGYGVALVFGFCVFVCARRGMRMSALRGGVKLILLGAALLLLPEIGMWHAWSALVDGSARVVFSDELYAYGRAYSFPLLWRRVPIALNLCFLLALGALIYTRRWPRPLRIVLLVLLLMVGGTQIWIIAQANGFFGGRLDRLPRPHYFEFYIPVFYSMAAAFVLRYWLRLLPRGEQWQLQWRHRKDYHAVQADTSSIVLRYSSRSSAFFELAANFYAIRSRPILVGHLQLKWQRMKDYLSVEARASYTALCWAIGFSIFCAFCVIILISSNRPIRVGVGGLIFGLFFATAILIASRNRPPFNEGRYKVKRFVSNTAVLGLFGLAAGTWAMAPAQLHPIFARTCTHGLFWCEDRAGFTIGAAATPITEFLQQKLARSEAFSGRAETLLMPSRRFVFPTSKDVQWTPELFERLKSWYRRAYEAQPAIFHHSDYQLALEPDAWGWDRRELLRFRLQAMAANGDIYYGVLPENLITEIMDWSAHQFKPSSDELSEVAGRMNEVGVMVEDRNRAFALTGNGMMLRALPMQDIPVASSYEQALDYLYYLFWTRYINEQGGARYVRSINFTALEVVHVERLALLGVRYIIKRESMFEPALALPKVMTYKGYAVYEIPFPNIVGYSPHTILFGKTLAEELAMMRTPGFDPRRTAVLSATEQGKIGALALAPMRNPRISLRGNDLVFEAESAGEHSLAVLPFRFSSCLTPLWDAGSGHLVRADLGLVGLIFSGQVKVRLQWSAGYANVGCLREDLRMVPEAQQAAKQFPDWVAPLEGKK